MDIGSLDRSEAAKLVAHAGEENRRAGDRAGESSTWYSGFLGGAKVSRQKHNGGETKN
jgi:hypothetical protein